MRLLRIDLSSRTFSIHEIDLETEKRFLGGRGIGAKILYDELKPGIDPLGPENKVVFATSSLIGSQVPSCVKYSVVTKSPLSGTILMSLAGGFFGAKLRSTAYDGIILEGKLENPGYIYIDEDKAEIRDASSLWGMTTDCTQETIKEQLGSKNLRIACIGPAAEKLVRFSSIISDRRAVGRGGAGAVLASKNVKAIAVTGSRKHKPKWEEDFNKAVSNMKLSIRQSPKAKVFSKFGTPGVLALTNERGILPTYNCREGFFESADKINGQALQNYVTKSTSCYRCPLACGNIAAVKEGAFAGAVTEGPEYETLCSFGSMCGNDNLEAIIKADQLCDQYGLDTISTGNCIAFAMELYENGIITSNETDGLPLNFGNAESMIQMIHKIARREGFGNVLAEGVRKASEIIGNGAEQFAMHCKGLEWPAYDPRGAKAMAISYATSPRGACHERGLIRRETFGAPPAIDRFAVEGKGLVAKEAQDHTTIEDALGFCVLAVGNGQLKMADIALAFSAMLGSKVTVEDLFQAAERIWTVERLFNIREGFDRKDDVLPERFLKETHSIGPSAGAVVELDVLLDDYYKVRGWDQNGIPTAELLIRLGIVQ